VRSLVAGQCSRTSTEEQSAGSYPEWPAGGANSRNSQKINRRGTNPRPANASSALVSRRVHELAREPLTRDVSVVIPTIGRPEQLRVTLESLVACLPRAAEIVVVDQSEGDAVSATVDDFAAAGVIRLPSSGRGIGLAMNEGIRRARHEIVLGTDDDCSVAGDWIDVGFRLASDASECIYTGRVLALGKPEAVPSTKDDPRPQDFTGETRCDVLFAGNMVLPRSQVLRSGGFDDRFERGADNDFCYRWLRAGGCLRYEPTLVVWHREWRTKEEVRQLHVRYWRAHGRFYSKYLRRRDVKVLRFLGADFVYTLDAFRALFSAVLKRRRPLLGAEHRALFVGFIPGLVEGWREFGKEDADSD
jgi:GT2 family glycosyltransferase